MNMRILSQHSAIQRNPITGYGCLERAFNTGRRHFSIQTGVSHESNKGKKTYPTPPPSPCSDSLKRRVSVGCKTSPAMQGILPGSQNFFRH